jgi:hypothetical protein
VTRNSLAYDLSGELFLRERWREVFGEEAPVVPTIKTTASLEELRETEWSPRFERLMRNRLIMGALRYGRINSPRKLPYDRVTSMIGRLSEFRETRNKELLVDVANLALLEFEEGTGHFAAFDEREHVSAIDERDERLPADPRSSPRR